MDTFRHEGLTFDVVDTGPRDAADAATVVLLHGFPQTSHAWADVTPRLTGAGLRCLAPALRGFSPGAVPPGRRAYRIEHLAADALALLDAAGVRDAHVVGHDWGGAVAWHLAQFHPGRVRTLTVLSTPHPEALARAARTSTQGLKSWYMAAMQVPRLPEAVLGRELRRRGLGSLGLPAHHEAAYLARLLEPGALTGAVAAYRAIPTRPVRGAGDRATPVSVPTTYVWGRRDAYLGREAAELTGRYCAGDYRFVEVEADHWLPEKCPEQVAAEILRRVAG